MPIHQLGTDQLFMQFNYDFMALADYSWKKEEAIDDLLREEQRRWASMPDFQARLMRKQWEAWKLVDFFPTTLRYSFVVALFIHVESKLTQLRDHLQSTKNLPVRMAHLNGNLFERSKRYLSSIAELPISSLDWSAFEELMKVRDCIVHCNGNILLSRDQQYLRGLSANRRSGHLRLSFRNGQEGEWLSIQRDYGMILTADVRDFISSIGGLTS